MFLSLFIASSLAAVITFLLTPPTLRYAKKWGLVDNPKKRPHPAHTHTGVIPRAGGVPIFLGIFLPLMVIFQLNLHVIGIFLASLILILTGLWDDKKDRSPYIRLTINIVVAVMVILSGVTISYITNPLGGILHLDVWKLQLSFGAFQFSFPIISFLVTLIWIVWTTNIVGWSGGVDGQLPGFVAISAFVIGLLSLRFVPTDSNQLTVTYLSFLTAGAYLGFLPFNFSPQKIMPGYGGKALAGFLLAVLSILSSSKLGTALLVLSVPMIDAGWIILSRIVSGRSPVWASAHHLHHHLLSRGWGKRKIAYFYWFISALAGVAALTLNSRQKIFVWLLIAVIIIGFILLINLFGTLTNEEKSM